MSTNNDNIFNEETRWETNEPNTEQVETANNPVSENEPAKAKSNNGVVKSTVTGAVGVVAGAAGVIAAMSFRESDESNQGTQTPPIPEPAQFIGAEVPVAQSVNDDMSFNEAFATARQEVGPGGIFTWHGGIYGTYYKDEWQGFSDEYRESFSNYAYDVKPEPYIGETLYAADERDANDVSPSADKPEPAELPAGDFPLTDEPELTEQPVDVFPPADEPELAELPADDFPPMDEPVLAELPADDFPPVDEPVLAELPEMNEVPENEDNVVIINAQSVIVVNANDTGSDEQDVTVVPVHVDGQDVAVVNTDFDNGYDITVVEDHTDSGQSSIDLVENDGGNITDGNQDLPDTPVPTPDAVSNDTISLDYMLDFSNNEDISGF